MFHETKNPRNLRGRDKQQVNKRVWFNGPRLELDLKRLSDLAADGRYPFYEMVKASRVPINETAETPYVAIIVNTEEYRGGLRTGDVEQVALIEPKRWIEKQEERRKAEDLAAAQRAEEQKRMRELSMKRKKLEELAAKKAALEAEAALKADTLNPSMPDAELARLSDAEIDAQLAALAEGNSSDQNFPEQESEAGDSLEENTDELVETDA